MKRKSYNFTVYRIWEKRNDLSGLSDVVAWSGKTEFPKSEAKTIARILRTRHGRSVYIRGYKPPPLT